MCNALVGNRQFSNDRTGRKYVTFSRPEYRYGMPFKEPMGMDTYRYSVLYQSYSMARWRRLQVTPEKRHIKGNPPLALPFHRIPLRSTYTTMVLHLDRLETLPEEDMVFFKKQLKIEDEEKVKSLILEFAVKAHEVRIYLHGPLPDWRRLIDLAILGHAMRMRWTIRLSEASQILLCQVRTNIDLPSDQRRPILTL